GDERGIGEPPMMTRIVVAACGAFLFTIGTVAAAPALSQKECSAKYQAAQAANTLKGMKYPEFRKTQCSADAQATTTGTPAAEDPRPGAARGPAGPATGTAAVFPDAVAPKYASEKAGTARLHTCRDQYNANKAGNANGGLRWIQKGGGYWSE